MKHKSEVCIKGIEVTKNNVAVYFSCIGEIKNYLNGNVFSVEYNCEIDTVPESILLIPFLSTICPLSWITDSTVYCDSVDLEYLNCLDVVKSSFQSIFPHYSWKGTLKYNKLVHNQKELQIVESRSGLFFSGGVDSTASYIQLKDKNPTLITVWGADVPFENGVGWKYVLNEIEHFASSVGSEVSLIKSNFRDIINYPTLREEVLTNKEHWWPNFQHGLGTIGLAAPITYEQQITNLYFAASLNPHHKAPIGSSPEIDNNIKWGNKEFNVYHHSYILRSEKISIIRDYINKENADLRIRVCYLSEDGKNCSKCPKCIMTIIYLLLAGLDPESQGFERVDEQFLINTRTWIENGLLGEAFHRFIDMQNQISNVKDSIPAFSRDFFNWLAHADLKKILRKYERTQKWYQFKGKIKKTFVNV